MEATAKNVDKTARTAYEMAEAQRDSFEALAENFAATQRRSMGLAEGGLEFVKLQEDNARAAQEFFANGVRLLQHQQKNAEFVQSWTGDAVEVLREQTEHNTRTAEAFARAIGRQQESIRTLTQGWVGAYTEFFSPFAYARQGMRAFQQATQQSLEATEQVAKQGLRVAEESTKQGLRVAEDSAERTDKVLRQTEKATHEAELRSAVFSALGTTDYDGLSVEEVSRRIDGLPAEQLKKVRRVREGPQEPRDPHRTDRPQDKGQLLRRTLSKRNQRAGAFTLRPSSSRASRPVPRPGELPRNPYTRSPENTPS